jgi:hypothetical protein
VERAISPPLSAFLQRGEHTLSDKGGRRGKALELSPEEFAEAYKKLGPAEMARHYGIRERNVSARRRRLEVEMNTPIQGPRTNPAAHCVAVSEHPHRVMLTVPNGTVIVAGDAHYWPGEPSLMHRALVAFCKEMKPRAVIFNGDVIDAPQISRHPPIGWEKRPQLSDEIEAAKERLYEVELAAFKAEKIWNLGNHDCLDPETECLTKRGWLKYTDIVPDDKVLSLIDNKAVWSGINEIVTFPFDGDLICVEKTRCSLAVTPNHRVLLSRLNWRSKHYDIREYRHANDLPSSFNLPMAALSNNEEADISDDKISLTGWVLTDGGYRKGHVSIYQSKPQGLEIIESLLNRLKIAYTRSIRQREARIICGRSPVNNPLPAAHFFVRAKDSRWIKSLIPDKKRLPAWTNDLSDRQFNVLLDAIVAGDGVWDGYSPEKKTCCVIYGKYEILSDIQALASQHGWRARLRIDTRNDPRLCLTKIEYLRIEKDEIFKKPYKGTVWCLRVAHENFMVRRNGCAYFTGNSRFETRIATVAPEYAKIHGVHLRDHFPHWRSAWSSWINNTVVAKHRFKGGQHAPFTNTVYAGKSIITGHLHSAKVIPFTDYNGTRYGVDTGCIAETDAKAFVDYCEDSPRNWRSAFCILTFIDGEMLQPELVLKFDERRVEFRGKLICP